MKVEANSIVVRGTEQVFVMIDGELVIMNINEGKYFGLDGVGLRIWELIAEPCRVNKLCELLMTEYDVVPVQCEANVIQFLNEMAYQQLIVICEA